MTDRRTRPGARARTLFSVLLACTGWGLAAADGGPVAELIANPVSGPAPLVVTLDATASTAPGAIVSYAWDIAGTPSTDASTTHSFEVPGTYTVTLTVEDEHGATDFAEVSITAFAPGPPERSVPFLHTVVDPVPPTQSHVKEAGDVDGDGFPDLLVGGAHDVHGLFWYRYPDWTKHTIVPAGVAGFTTDMRLADVDGDGDLDVVVPAGFHYGDRVGWIENPRPAGDPATTAWVPHPIGEAPAHDLEVGDVDLDGRPDVVVRVNRTTLFLQGGPDTWQAVELDARPLEGLALGDLDLDGDLDVVQNGFWLENPLPGAACDEVPWVEHTIDAAWPEDAKVAVADVNADGRPDVLGARSESAGWPLVWYERDADGERWARHVIDDAADFTHSLEVGDVDLDGDLDVVTAEMQQSVDPDEVRVYRNEGGGRRWSRQVVDTVGSHNLRLVDVGGDGDLDLFGVNWLGETPADLWESALRPGLDRWRTHEIDDALPWRGVFMLHADLDGDGLEDLLTGGWWFRNPGDPGDPWPRSAFGSPLDNVAWVHDFDADGDLDVLGTNGRPEGDTLSWGRNDGAGGFEILPVGSSEAGATQFLQGVAGGTFAGGPAYEIALSWQGGEDGTSYVERLTVPVGDPATEPWVLDELHPGSLGEALTAADVDRDGDLDLHQGSHWLRNDGGGAWTQLVANGELDPALGGPDRNRVADVDGDGDLDVVVGFSHFPGPDTSLLWLEAPDDPTEPWAQRTIATGVWGGYSLDVADLDFDSDPDVVLGEHRGGTRLFVFENAGGGNGWARHLVHPGGPGIDHHDGSLAVDIDHDGDLDIVSTGWDHFKVWVFENLGGTPHGLLCGNAVLDGGEQCDDGNRNDGDGCQATCLDPACGDGVLDAGEACDDGNLRDGDGCQSSCALPFCGDGIVDPDEACDHGAANSDVVPDACRTDCVPAGCGDGVIDGGEDCEDGNAEFGDGCQPTCRFALELDRWRTHLVDPQLPWRAVFAAPADVDGDGDPDVVAGGFWYENPGTLGGAWARHAVGTPMHNMAWVRDFDGDGDADVLGTEGQPESGSFVWARNDGAGSFEVLGPVAAGAGPFLGGVAPGPLVEGGPYELGLSWNGGETGASGVSALAVPADPASDPWPIRALHPVSEGEALSSGDLDGDGDLDLFQGRRWLRNDGASWTQFVARTLPGNVDRNRLADLDGDGDLDAVVGFLEDPSDLVWLEAPADPTGTWGLHTIAAAIGGGLSLDVADMDYDHDVDVVLGEHWGQHRLILFENDGTGATWTPHVLDPGGSAIEHHDGSRVVDLDGDGDLDVISLGWFEQKLWVFENMAIDAAALCQANADCDDDLYCNGVEWCSGIECRAGDEPCPGRSCDEATHVCDTRVGQLEAGRAVVGQAFVRVHLANTYERPVVVCSVERTFNFSPVVPRVRDVTSDGFDVRLQSPSGAPVVPDLVHYLVVEEGAWTLDGVKVEAQQFVALATDRSGSWAGTPRPYGQPYAAPVVLAQVMTENDLDWSVAWQRGETTDLPPSPSALHAGKAAGEDPQPGRREETVGIVVFETAHGTLGGTEFEAGVGEREVYGIDDGPPVPYDFDGVFATAPQVVLTSLAGLNEDDGGWSVTQGPAPATATALFASIDEDRLADDERAHVPERVAYVAFAAPLVHPAPVCGNGELEPGEDCDDGNAVDGDGCSPDCRRTLRLWLEEGEATAGATVTVRWTGVEVPTARDWIGLYAAQTSDSAFLVWFYTSSCTTTPGGARDAGSCSFVVPAGAAAGIHDLRLFANNGYERLARSAPFIVGAAGATLGATPDVVEIEGQTTVAWSGIASPAPTDWIGLFPAGAEAWAGVEWFFVGCSRTPSEARASGSCPLALPAGVGPGTYELRLFAASGFELLAVSPPLFVTPPAPEGPAISAIPGSALPGESTTASWSGIEAPSSTDWIALARAGAANNAVLQWFYVNCTRTAGAPRPAGSCPVPLPGTLAPGEYELRLFASNAYTRLATSEPLILEAPEPSPLGLEVSPDEVDPGDVVTATWAGIPSPTPRDWIALAAEGSANNAVIDWIFVSCTRSAGPARADGSCAWTLPATLAAGTYELRLFADNGYTRLATSNALTVTAPAAGATTLSIVPGTATAGTSVEVQWSGIASPNARDWIGLFAAGAAHNAARDWFYVSCTRTAGAPRASGTCPLALASSLPAGTYEARLFSNNGYGLLATSGPLAVSPAAGGGSPQIATTPASVPSGASATVTWDGISPASARDWIGLYRIGAADNAPRDWFYVSCTRAAGAPRASGSCPLPLPASVAPPDVYEVRLFADNGYTRLATSDPLTVTPAAGSTTTLAASPATIVPGGNVTATWSGIPSATRRDWIGIYAAGAANNAFLDWFYVSCTKAAAASPRPSGSCVLPLPASLAPGSYELRIFPNDGFVPLAVSDPLVR